MSLTTAHNPTFLAIDVGSNPVTIAVGNAARIEVEELSVGESSSLLLDAIDQELRKCNLDLGGIDGVLCTAGPGSFTGLRIGMATLLGLHASRRLPAVALPTLWVQAAKHQLVDHFQCAQQESAQQRPVWSAIPAHRGQTYLQEFDADGVRGRGAIATVDNPGAQIEASTGSGAIVVSSSKASLDEFSNTAVEAVDCGALAECLVRLALVNPPATSRYFAWNAATLTKPLYAQTPAVSALPRTTTATTLVSSSPS